MAFSAKEFYDCFYKIWCDFPKLKRSRAGNAVLRAFKAYCFSRAQKVIILCAQKKIAEQVRQLVKRYELSEVIEARQRKRTFGMRVRYVVIDEEVKADGEG